MLLPWIAPGRVQLTLKEGTFESRSMTTTLGLCTDEYQIAGRRQLDIA